VLAHAHLQFHIAGKDRPVDGHSAMPVGFDKNLKPNRKPKTYMTLKIHTSFTSIIPLALAKQLGAVR